MPSERGPQRPSRPRRTFPFDAPLLFCVIFSAISISISILFLFQFSTFFLRPTAAVPLHFFPFDHWTFFCCCVEKKFGQKRNKHEAERFYFFYKKKKKNFFFFYFFKIKKKKNTGGGGSTSGSWKRCGSSGGGGSGSLICGACFCRCPCRGCFRFLRCTPSRRCRTDA